MKKRNPPEKGQRIFDEPKESRLKAIELAEKFKDIKIDKKLLK